MALGALNGLLVWKLGIPSIVVTLGTLTIYRGATFVLSGGAWVNADQMSPAFIDLQRAAVPRHPGAVVDRHRWRSRLSFVLMTRTALGRSIYAIGVNPTAAVYAGIDVGRTKFIAFCISGLVGGLCGYLWISRYVIASVEVANGYELNIIAACVIGGISIAGGIGSVGGAVLGALFLGIITNALPVINISPFWQMAISGSAIILAVVLNARGERSQGRIILQEGGGGMSAASSTPPAAAAISPTGSTSRSRARLLSWEALLVVVAVAIFAVNSFASPYFLDPWSLSDLTFNFTEKALIALAMALLIIAGEIDLSVAAIDGARLDRDGHGGAGRRRHAGAGRDRHRRRACLRRLQRPAGDRFGLPSIVVTIGTMSLFRGIAFIVLGDQAYKGYPADFAFFGQGYVWWVVSFELALFLVAAVDLLVPAAPDEFRPPRLRHRQQPGRRAVFRRPRRPHQVHPVLPDRPDVGHRRRC